MIITVTLVDVTTAGVVSLLPIPTAKVDHQFNRKYRIDKRSQLDPLIRIQRDPYYDDTISITGIDDAEMREEIADFIKNANDLYLQYYVADTLKTYPVYVIAEAPLQDKLRGMSDSQVWKFGSLYDALSNYDITEGIMANPLNQIIIV
jgi:hypothetical protein